MPVGREPVTEVSPGLVRTRRSTGSAATTCVLPTDAEDQARFGRRSWRV